MRPNKKQLFEATGRTVPDVIAPNLLILFCGINPGLYSAWSGHHFARPGNRFWPALFASGFTDRLIRPEEERELLRHRFGLTNLVDRATLASDELTREELQEGGRGLEQKIRRYRIRAVAVLGVSAHRVAFQCPAAQVGRQRERLGGAVVWVLPNPSGLNAHFTPRILAEVFREFRLDVMRRKPRP